MLTVQHNWFTLDRVRKAEQSARTKRALIEAAMALFAERGYRATSLKAIAARASISHGVIPFHFGSKEGLLLAVVESCFGAFRDAAFGPLLDRARDHGLGDLEALTDAMLAFQCERPRVGRLFQVLMFEALGPTPELRPHFGELHRRLRALGGEWVREGQARGSLDPRLDVEATVDALLCFFTGLRTHSLLFEGDVDQARIHAQMRSILARGVRAEPPEEDR
ncbi:MAG TPA: TetR family transcriptional regulator [Sandaracinaceae bacterium LLY-WYZ-13_1]|nr:TetR family transcriptional regulator [Sandaracinaceae bacterium LLY-WYZ-13_1]